MKKVSLLMAAACITAAANATILRVNNATGSSAPYSTIAAAQEAAQDGDTIMVDASTQLYDQRLTLTKSIVLIGPGYSLVDNGIMEEGASCAQVYFLDIDAPGCTVSGMYASSGITITEKGSNSVVTRCSANGISLKASNCVIHQNYLRGWIAGGSGTARPFYAQITNNIIYKYSNYSLTGISNSYIAYNTILYKYSLGTMSGVSNCTVEHNILPSETNPNGEGSEFKDNYIFGEESPFEDISTEMAIVNAEKKFSDGTYGALGGNDPYVISGVPAGPVIEDINVPVSVEKGNKLNVTIKLGLQK